MMFLLPRSEVETVDTWHISGMCGTGSWDYLIDDVFVPPERAVPFLGLLDGSWGVADRYEAPLYSTPLVPTHWRSQDGPATPRSARSSTVTDT
jgi:3-hydroxy-9,10-secoandrosta-1,3,5(10)-triene-9,17-dione monooxygenase